MDMKKCLSALLAVVLLASACLSGTVFVASAEDDEVAAAPHAFIKSGLVAYYEGTQNTRDGHDTDGTVWEDLVGGHDMTVVVDDNNYFTSEGYHLNSVENFFPETIVQTVNAESFTVELQIKDLVSLGADFNTIMNSRNDNFALFRRNSVNELEFKQTHDISDRPKAPNGLESLQDCLITITRSVIDSKCRLYVNGELKKESISPVLLGVDNLFFGHASASKNYEATYCAMRFYSYDLSEAEVKHNAAVAGYLSLEELYVQDGLVALYSGVSNTKDGYVEDSAVWQDLVGDNHITLSAEGGTTFFTKEGLRTTGVRHYLPESLVDVVNGETFTVEIQFGDFISIGESFNTFLNSSNDAFSLYRDSINDLLHFKFATNLLPERPKVEGALELLDNGLVTATYEVGGKCRLYVNGALKAEVDAPLEMGADDLFIGHNEGHKLFDSTYKSIRFYDRVLTDEEIAHNADVDGCLNAGNVITTPSTITVAQPKTNIAGDVAMIRDVNSSDDLRAMMAMEKRPAAAIYTVDAELQVLNSKGEAFTTLLEALETTEYGVLPILRISDKATVQAIKTFMSQQRFYDICVISTNAALVAEARATCNTIRAAIDLTEAYADQDALTKEDCVSIRRLVKKHDASVAILPAAVADRDMVQYLYDMQIQVWVDAADKLSRAEAYDALLSGATGVISDSTGTLLNIACNELPLYTMTRVPQNVGHRGIPSQAPENTIEGAQAAYENGANCIEIDVYMTTDGEIVVMHDATTLRTCGVDLAVESCTWEQLSQLYANVGYENDPAYKEARIPRFDDYLNFIKDKDCRLFIEIKTTNNAIVPALRDKIEAAGLYDQCTFITFHSHQLQNVRTYYPEMVGGLLCSGYLDEIRSNEDILGVMNAIGPVGATLNPQYAGYGENAIRAALLRGISVLPWTFGSASAPYMDPYLWGYSGLTGDNADQMKRYLKDVTLTGVSDGDTFEVGATVLPVLEVTTYNRNTANSTTAKIVILEGEDIATVGKDGITFTGAGNVTFVVEHTVKSSGKTQAMYAQPITVTVKGDEEESSSVILPEDTTEAEDETTQPAEEDSRTANGEESTAATEKTGCKSVLGVGSVALLVVAAGAVMVRAKKRDEEI